MIDEKLLKWIRCPITGQSLRLSDAETLATLNQKISSGTLRDRSDQLVAEGLQGGLVNENADVLYPIRSGIPCLVVTSAIDLKSSVE
ncbi:Trm112 family protein [Stieleria sp. JC731]|uniref:Trm112 family protein n=1 Tax=Pirellulaceae TaxID=2691357 RepID=UPI001E463EEB|nr:Trm112 family protein [Stieleria sp. JC731]MCC9599337.1 Trm112 family protein [Stieleria sp. JC731]